VIGFTQSTPGDNITIDYYENGSSQPTKTREIIVAVLKLGQFIYPYLEGTNILSPEFESDTINAGIYYPMSVQVPESSTLTVIIQGTGWDYTDPVNWIISPYDEKNKLQVFATPLGPCNCDLTISFTQPGDIQLLCKEDNKGVINNFTRYLMVLDK
jgi:hypothetical protein